MEKPFFKVFTGSLLAYLTPIGANIDELTTIPNNAGKYIYPKLHSGNIDEPKPVIINPREPKSATITPQAVAIPILCLIGRPK